MAITIAVFTFICFHHNNLHKIAHKVLNVSMDGLADEVDDLKKDMMILKNDIREKDLEIGKMMKKLQD